MLSTISLNIFNSVQDPRVVDTLSLNEVLQIIRTGGNHLAAIEEARRILLIEGKKREYAKLKTIFPCTNYGFTFQGYRNNENILGPTGLMPVDEDRTQNQIDNKYIIASFRSLSTRGMTYIIRVEGLNIFNYRYNYERIAKELGIVPDMSAGKASQPFVLPYSKQINFNPQAQVISAYQVPKNPHTIPEKKERVIGNEVGEIGELRFNNLKDYTSSIDFDGEAIFDFKEKFKYASLYVPITRITEGSRNNILSGIGYQFRCLNPHCTVLDIENLLNSINSKYAQPELPYRDIKKIAKSLHSIPKENLVPILNDTKRFIFNTKVYELTLEEKRSLVITALNKDRGAKTKKEIVNKIKAWDFKKDGKITQKKLADVTGRNIKTIEKYYPEFKSLIKSLNNKHKPP